MADDNELPARKMNRRQWLEIAGAGVMATAVLGLGHRAHKNKTAYNEACSANRQAILSIVADYVIAHRNDTAPVMEDGLHTRGDLFSKKIARALCNDRDGTSIPSPNGRSVYNREKLVLERASTLIKQGDKEGLITFMDAEIWPDDYRGALGGLRHVVPAHLTDQFFVSLRAEGKSR